MQKCARLVKENISKIREKQNHKRNKNPKMLEEYRLRKNLTERREQHAKEKKTVPANQVIHKET